MEEIKKLYDVLESSSTDDFLVFLEKQMDFNDYTALKQHPAFIKNTVVLFCLLSVMVAKNSPYRKNFENKRFFLDCIEALYCVHAFHSTLPLKELDGFESYYPFRVGNIAYDSEKHMAQLKEMLHVDTLIDLLEEYIEREKAHYCHTKRLLVFSGKTYQYKSIIIPLPKTFLSAKALKEADAQRQHSISSMSQAGWRLVQIIQPFGAESLLRNHYELIFEKETNTCMNTDSKPCTCTQNALKT